MITATACTVVLTLSLFAKEWQPVSAGPSLRATVVAAIQATNPKKGKDNFATFFNFAYTCNILDEAYNADGTDAAKTPYAIFEAVDNSKKQEKMVDVKVFRGGSTLPLEFTILPAVYGAKITNGPSKEDMFVPNAIKTGRATFIDAKAKPQPTTKQFDFIVMDQVGPTIDQLLKVTSHEVALRPEDAERLLRRMFLILTSIHEASYAHLDGRTENWGLSPTKASVLYLVNWGNAKQLNIGKPDFRPVIQDLLHWTEAAAEIGDRWHGMDTTFTNKITEKVGELQTLIKQNGVVKEHKNKADGMFSVFEPGMNLKLDSLKAVKDSPLYKQFREIVNGWLLLNEDSFASTTALTLCTPETMANCE